MNQMSYGQYLKLDELLSLQHLQSNPNEHDELLFITIHQSYELWFKQILHEIKFLQKNLRESQLVFVSKTLARILTILKVIVSKVDILETMSPLDFKSFRGALKNSSGFQSVQFRKLELILGLHYESALKNKALSEAQRQELKDFSQKITIWEDFVLYLQKNFDSSIESPKRVNQNGYIFNPSEQNQKKIYTLILENPNLFFLIELLTDLDEGLQEWRYRHVKMVERTIGSKMGTGGSSGIDYLKSTLHTQIFPDLWQVRNLF